MSSLIITSMKTSLLRIVSFSSLALLFSFGFNAKLLGQSTTWVDSSATALNIFQSGSGGAIYALTQATSDGIAVYGRADGNGTGVYARTAGSGTALHAYATGSGLGVYARADNAGHAGSFRSLGAGSGVYVHASGTGYGVYSLTSGSGTGVYGRSMGSGHGVEGRASAGGIGVYSYMDVGTTNYGSYVYQQGTGIGSYTRVSNASSVAEAVKVQQDGLGIGLNVTSANNTAWSGSFTGGKGLFADRVAIGGNESSVYKLAVLGGIISDVIEVKASGTWADYVFKEDYSKMSLAELESFIKDEGHLPYFPSAKAVEEKGSFNVGETQVALLKTIEELTLHLIEQGKEIKELKMKIN